MTVGVVGEPSARSVWDSICVHLCNLWINYSFPALGREAALDLGPNYDYNYDYIFRRHPMSAYSVADAKAGLPALINRALAGEEVIITRHGKPVAELRPATSQAPVAKAAFYDWLISRRSKPAVSISSVELLDLIYDES